MKTFSLFLLTILIGLSSAQAEKLPAYKRLELQLEKEYGIEIEFENLFFDPAGPDPYKFVEVPVKKRTSVLKKLRIDLRLYPRSVIVQNLKVIKIYSGLTINGYPFGGTVKILKQAIYVQDVLLGGADELRTSFHHEFSSILMFNYDNPIILYDWMDFSKSIQPYTMEGAAGWEMLQKGDRDLKGGPQYYQKGFICGYGQTDFENDFNTYFERYMFNKRNIIAIAEKYPNVNKKLKILEEFYLNTVLRSEKQMQSNSKIE